MESTVVAVLRGLGGVATSGQLVGRVTRYELWQAVLAGLVQQPARGLYAITPATRALVVARQLKACRSHTTAAAEHGFALPPDDGIHLTVPWKARRLRVPADVRLHYRDLPETQVLAGCTSELQTVLDCLRDLSVRDALTVGDSALRSRRVCLRELEPLVANLRGPGSARAAQRLAWLDARAENAFESCCRALVLEAGITGFVPQVNIHHRRQWIGRADLAHRALRVLIECDGFATHGGREKFVADLVRHTRFVAAGWRPLRFTWQQVMFEPEWVLERVRETVYVAERP